MSDSFFGDFNFNPSYSGSAADYAGTISDYNIGPQSFGGGDFFTTPAASYGSFDVGGTYTPTFDFASYLPSSSYLSPADLPAAGGGPAFGPVPTFASEDLGGFRVPTTDTTTPTPTAGTQPASSLQSQALAEQDALGGGRKAADTAAQQGLLDRLFGKMSGGDITKLVLGGAGGLMQYLAGQRAQADAAAAAAEYRKAGKKAAADLRAMGEPYRAAGGSQLAMALQGALSPAQMQLYQAGQAKLAQSAARTGGVGAIQTAAAEQAIYQQALQNQQDMALKLLGPGNELAYKAVMAELQAKQGGLSLELQYGSQASSALGAMMSALGYGVGSQGRTS